MNLPFHSLGAQVCALASVGEGLPCRNSRGQAFTAESDQRGVIGSRARTNPGLFQKRWGAEGGGF